MGEGEGARLYLNIIMKTIMMGKMEMVLPDIHMMNRFINQYFDMVIGVYLTAMLVLATL